MLQIVKGPYLQWPTRTTMTIMWETSQDASAEVFWWDTETVHSGLDGRYRTLESTEKRITSDSVGSIHRVELTGLEPGTSYHYRVGSALPDGETIESEIHPLRTAPNADRPFSFVVFSEMGGYNNEAITRQLLSLIPSYRPDFVLIVGDAPNRGSLYEDWSKWLFGPGHRLFLDTPFYLCLGNHEGNSPWFYKLVAYPEPKNYYAFDYGNAHFTALDSTELVQYRDRRPALSPEALSPGSPQYDFAVHDLASADATWRFVFFHYPPYVSGDYQVEEMRGLCPLLEQHGVDVVFNSHTIVYERSHPIRADRLDRDSGVVYIVAGGAGAMPQWFHHKRAWHTAHAVAVPHFVQVVIAGTHLEMKAIDVDGRLFDAMTLAK